MREEGGRRYDSRDGVFDWDYHMQLAERGGGRAVDAREYRHWRRTGVAFTWTGVEARHPNCSLASGVVRICGQLCHHGYLGDIVSGPYPAYGIACEPQEADLLKTTNGVRAHRSTDITERNLLRIFHELQTGQPYEHTPDPDVDGSKVIMELPDVQDCVLEEQQHKGALQQETYSAIPTGTAQVTFLPIGAVQSCRPAKERQDLMFVSQLMWESLGPAVTCFAREGTRVVAETRALVVGPREEALRQFGTDLERAAKECGCSLLAAFDGAKDPVARFKVTNTSS